jgi:hypothetical protein
MSKARDLANAGTALTTVSATELGYLDGVTSAVQTQINSKIGQSTAINPTIVDAKGDIIAATGADAVSRLAVGANGTVLTAASGEATGLQWATPSSGGMTVIASGSLSGTSVTISSIPATYNNLQLVVRDFYTQGFSSSLLFRLNGVTTNTYDIYGVSAGQSTPIRSRNPYVETFLEMASDNNTSSILTIFDYANSSVGKSFIYQGCRQTTGNIANIMVGGNYIDSNPLSSITIFNTYSETISGGTYILYGVK